jgi:hypothetical protein
MDSATLTTSRTFSADGTTTASVTDIGQGASGNIGVNVATGAFNNQANATLISTASQMGSATATIGSVQSVSGLKKIVAAGTQAVLGGSAFAGASGNIGVNIASGVANQQSNSLVLHP